MDPSPDVEEELVEAEEEFEDEVLPELLPPDEEPDVVVPRETREVADRNAAEPPPVCRPFVDVTDVEDVEDEELEESLPPVEVDPELLLD